MPNNIFASRTSAHDPAGNCAARVAVAAPRRVIDLGCGPGNSTGVLAERWPKAELTGLDSSPEMIAAARRAAPGLDWRVGDMAAWGDEKGQTYDVVFSSAALQWLDDHAAAFPKLLSRVAPGGALAVQMPGNYEAPAHCLMRARLGGFEGVQTRKCLKINDRMFQVFTTELLPPGGFGLVIFGGGWAGNSSLRRCNNSWTSVSGCVYRLSMTVRSSVVGRCTSNI